MGQHKGAVQHLAGKTATPAHAKNSPLVTVFGGRLELTLAPGGLSHLQFLKTGFGALLVGIIRRTPKGCVLDLFFKRYPAEKDTPFNMAPKLMSKAWGHKPWLLPNPLLKV